VSEETSDEALVNAARKGDAQAMETLYQRYRRWAFAVAVRFCDDHQDAADALQESFIHFFDRFPDFELRSSLKTYLYKVIKNKAIDVARRKKKFVPLEDEMLERIPGAHSDLRERRSRLEELLSPLAADERRLLLMRFHDGLTFDEIAGVLDVSIGTLKSKSHRALAKLRSLMAQIGLVLFNLSFATGV